MWNVITLGITQVLLMLCVSSYGILAMVISFSSLNILWLVVWNYFVRREIDFAFKEALVDIASFALTALIIMGAVYFFTQGIENLLVKMTSKILLGAILYLIVMFIFQRNLILEIVRTVFKLKR